MPVIESTIIAGYGPDVKQRLVTAFTRGVLSVMAAKMDGVIVILREVEPSNWARGGISRIPGPALPAAIDIARAYLEVIGSGDHARITALSGPDLAGVAPAGASYTGYEEAYTDHGSLVFAEGTDPAGRAVLTRLHVVAGRVLSSRTWQGDGAQP